MLNRRDAIKLGSVAAVAMALPGGRLAAALSDDPPVPAPFSVPLRIPPVLAPTRSTPDTDYYNIQIRETEQKILPGVRTKTLTYNGSFPGPTIRARRGRNTVVTQTNGMSTPATVHLHGANVPASSDGYPLDLIEPGQSRVYHYPNNQPAATLWYHDHAHHMEAEHVYRGLAGAYLLSDPIDQALPLPQGKFDVPLLIRDAKFDKDGQFVFVPDDFQNRPTILVNGLPQPYLKVQRRVYRLRLINAANIQPFTFRLSNGMQFLQIASDGGFLSIPAVRQEIDLWPSERAEVLVDFRSVAPGTNVVLEDTFSFTNVESKRSIMQFQVGHNAAQFDGPHSNTLPDRLVDEVPLGHATNTRRFLMQADPNTLEFLINGKPFDPNRVDATIKHGTTEIWEIVNGDTALQIPHAMHLHLVQFRVLDRNGNPEPAYDAYPKDTVRLHPGDFVRILVTFNSYIGRYPFHCHFIDHSSHSMMGQFEVVA
ncbi:multicopper oxidase family protein [Saccharopolyspora phatthalungensis]|uniref:FtsP/CotA-like multicopper oxidase with cupredoxin domain n=1 Tax=Saccharopolyspora phatthalungensis TaxID=664693 RepID=A0A840Q185_9PSEU|nr:multicopper oxidase domain-containing protein [Saccharopolyspora phatthalungensis]MBB5152558.1 FtsP/CotA-like multicopper oxidase with cupredoxin domain [Saccharopolyspora phatthalungensis]